MDTRSLTRISNRIYAYVGTTDASPHTNSFGANVGIVIGRDAVLVVDTLMSANQARHFLTDIRQLTDKPIRYVVNTHHHMDHTWGNCVFAAQGATIIAHEYTRQAMTLPVNGLSRASRYQIAPSVLEGTTITPPTLSFTQNLRIELGDIAVELQFPGPSHTLGAIVAYIPEDRVMFTGDILFTGYHATMFDADIAGWIKALSTIRWSGALTFIPGHGPVSSASDLQAMADYLQTFDTEAHKLCAGRSAADADALAQELTTRLPAQNRTELALIIKANLLARYLPSPSPPVQ